MTSILHISDTHFGTEVPEALAALTQAVADFKPDIIIASGDLTQRARKSQFRAGKKFIDSLRAPLFFAVPGNHDIPLFDIFTRFYNPYRLYKEFFGPREQFWHNVNLGILCLDATDPRRHTRGKVALAHARGKLERARAAIGAKPLIVVAHQPLAVRMPDDADEVLIEAAQTAALFSEFGVDAVLSGHVHMPLISTTAGIFPTLPRHFIMSGAGTAVSHRIRDGAPNSFNTLHVVAGKIEVSLHVFRADKNAFERADQSFFSPTTHGWLQDSN